MAAGTIPKPGSTYGPCLACACAHVDCAETRRMAAVLCEVCRTPIGYGRQFYHHDDAMAHAECRWAETDAYDAHHDDEDDADEGTA